MRLFILIMYLMFYTFLPNTYGYDFNFRDMKNYKDFLFTNSMKSIIASNLNNLKIMAVKICGNDVYKNKKKCMFKLVDEKIIIYKLENKERFIYDIKSNFLNKIN